jgi:hypothetical protein
MPVSVLALSACSAAIASFFSEPVACRHEVRRSRPPISILWVSFSRILSYAILSLVNSEAIALKLEE